MTKKGQKLHQMRKRDGCSRATSNGEEKGDGLEKDVKR
jgi:hypothetical protein